MDTEPEPCYDYSLDILITTSHQDIMFVNKDNSITIIELTIPFNAKESLDRGHALKTKEIGRPSL